MAAERASYDSNGRIVALLDDAGDLELSSGFVAVLPNGKRVALQSRREGRGAVRKERELAWVTGFALPDGGRGTLEYQSSEDAAGVRYAATVKADSPLEIEAIEWVLDLPRKAFVNGTIAADGTSPVTFTPVRTPSPILYSGDPKSLHLAGGGGKLALDVGFDRPTPVVAVDRWDVQGRSFQLRVVLIRGAAVSGQTSSLSTTLHYANSSEPPPPVKLTLDAAQPRYRFDGFGGNYCWNNQSPISTYTVEHLRLGWARTEMKVLQWDKAAGQPTGELRADFEMMQRFHKLGVPYVISIWWLPERFYTDAYEKPRSAHFRLIKPERWEELLELLGSYLLYAKREFGVEPDLFSFNEANIGIYVGLTPETHLEAIKRIGAHFRKIGLKTKMLLGDATGPRDTHKFVLEAAADPEALQYVGAIGFHSWGGGTPEQYAAWGDVAEWLQLPLLVTELGVDAAAYYTRSWDSYHYGLREAEMTQELLLYARPRGTQFWQFTNDYALARITPEGVVEPSPRFFLMKHFTDLTPRASQALTTSSDGKQVLFTAFRGEAGYALHVLNFGPARSSSLEGLPLGKWRVVQTTEGSQFQDKAPVEADGSPVTVPLPPKSLTTFVLAKP